MLSRSIFRRFNPRYFHIQMILSELSEANIKSSNFLLRILARIVGREINLLVNGNEIKRQFKEYQEQHDYDDNPLFFPGQTSVFASKLNINFHLYLYNRNNDKPTQQHMYYKHIEIKEELKTISKASKEEKKDFLI